MGKVALDWLGDELIEELEKLDDEALSVGAEVLKAAAQANAPVDDGDLRESAYVASSSSSSYVIRPIHEREITPNKGVVVMAFAAFYAHMIEGGTQAHVIRAKAEKSLRFGQAYRRTVRHPGTKARPFVRPALDESRVAIAKAYADYVRDKVTG